MAAQSIPVPRVNVDVTLSWISRVLQIPESEITDFKLSSDSSTSSGNLSNIVRVQFTQLEKSSPSFLIVKLLPLASDPGILEVMYSDKFDQKEIFFYQTLLPELLTAVPELKDYICPFYYAQIEEADPENSTLYASVLVLEDLKPLGYTMPSFDVGLSEQQISEGIDFAVKLSVAGQCLIQRKGYLPKIYPRLNDWHVPCEEGEKVFEIYKTLSWFPSGLEFIDQVLTWSPKSTTDMRTAYAALIPHAHKIIYEIFKEGQKYASITHDDLWPHNFLVTPNNSSRVKIIDWQMVGYADPVHDLSHFIFSCLPLEALTQQEITKWVTKYHKNYEELSATHKLGKQRRTLPEFLKYFFSYGISYALIWFALSCDSIFANPAYRPKLYRILELLYELKTHEFILTLVNN